MAAFCKLVGVSNAEHAPIGRDATTRASAEHVAHTEDTNFEDTVARRPKDKDSTFIEVRVQGGKDVSRPRTVTADADGSACAAGHCSNRIAQRPASVLARLRGKRYLIKTAAILRPRYKCLSLLMLFLLELCLLQSSWCCIRPVN